MYNVVVVVGEINFNSTHY